MLQPGDIDLDPTAAYQGGTWAEFVEGWDLGLFRDPIYAAAIAGAVLGFLSVYIVLKRMVFTSAGLSQAAGLGAAFSFYAAANLGFSVDPSYAAIGFALLGALVLTWDPRALGITREALLGLLYVACAGLVLWIMARVPQEATEIQTILFGPAFAVSDVDLKRVLVAGAGVMFLQLWWYRGFTFASFDRTAARIQGLPVRLLDALLLICIGVMVGAAARAIGALPVFALSTMPGTAALLLVRTSLPAAFSLATLFGVTAGVLGYIVAHLKGFPVGGSQTVVSVAIVIAALLARGGIIAVQRVRSPK